MILLNQIVLTNYTKYNLTNIASTKDKSLLLHQLGHDHININYRNENYRSSTKSRDNLWVDYIYASTILRAHIEPPFALRNKIDTYFKSIIDSNIQYIT